MRIGGTGAVRPIRINFRATALKTHVFSSFFASFAGKKEEKRDISRAAAQRSERNVMRVEPDGPYASRFFLDS